MFINFVNTKRTFRNHEYNDKIGTFINPNVWIANKSGFYFKIEDEDKFYLYIWISRKFYDKKMKRKTEKIYQYSSKWEGNSGFNSFGEAKSFAEIWLEDKLN